MPSVPYMNQSAPFWDFVASLEQQGQNHPFFAQNRNEEAEGGEDNHPRPFGPWGWGQAAFGGRSFPHRGPPPHHRPEEQDEENKENKENDAHPDNGEGPSKDSGSDTDGCARGRGHRGLGHGGPRRGRGCGGPRGHHGREGFGPHHGPHHHGRRGGWGPWGPWGRGGIFNAFNPMNFAPGLFDTADNEKNETDDFTPDADIFDTESAYVVHVSLPGAKKEDVGVNWDPEKSELSIAGVIYRPGGEEFLKTLAMDERKVGPFERKIRLGTRATPAQIDADMITAKLEDGVLRIDVPKLDSGYVEIKKVDVL